MVELGWLYVFSECCPLDTNLKCDRHCRRGALGSPHFVAFVKGVVHLNNCDFAGLAGKGWWRAAPLLSGSIRIPHQQRSRSPEAAGVKPDSWSFLLIYKLISQASSCCFLFI